MTLDLKDLYQEIIVDHNRSPRNFGQLADATQMAEGYNPLCGDKLNLYLKIQQNIIQEITFDGSGCAISVASGSLMTDALKGKTVEQAERLFHNFHSLIMQDDTEDDPKEISALGKSAALLGVRAYPSRVKCATLCWHALQSALHSDQSIATTE